MFSVGFCPGSQFAYIVFITSCTVHSLGICSSFCKMLSNERESSNGLKEWTKSGREHKPKKLKLSCSLSPACLITFGLCLTHVPVSQNDLSRKFQRSYLSGGWSGGSMLCFIMVSGMTTLTLAFEKEARKLLISLEVKN